MSNANLILHCGAREAAPTQRSALSACGGSLATSSARDSPRLRDPGADRCRLWHREDEARSVPHRRQVLWHVNAAKPPGCRRVPGGGAAVLSRQVDQPAVVLWIACDGVRQHGFQQRTGHLPQAHQEWSNPLPGGHLQGSVRRWRTIGTRSRHASRTCRTAASITPLPRRSC